MSAKGRIGGSHARFREGAKQMSDYKFNGTELRARNGSLVGKIDGSHIRDARGATVGQIDGHSIRDGRGARIGQVDGEHIKDASGHTIGSLTDARRDIEGPGGVSIAALWLLFVH